MATITGTAGPDTISLSTIDSDSISYTLNSGPTVTIDGITNGVQIDGGDEDDLLVIDMSSGALPNGGLHFDGGDGNDDLSVDASGANIVFDLNSNIAGTGSIAVGASAPITYENVEPNTVTLIGGATVTLNLTGGDAVDFSAVDADTSRAAGTSNAVEFDNPTTQLVINVQDANTYTLNFNDLADDFNPTSGIDINGGGGTDSVTITDLGDTFGHSTTGALDIDLGNGTDSVTFQTNSPSLASLSVAGETINLNVGSITASGDQSYSGSVVLGTDVELAGANIDVAGAIVDSSSDSLTVSSAGDITLTSVDISGSLDINLDTDTGGATLTAGALTAGVITIDGTGSDDTMTFSGDVTATKTDSGGVTGPGSITIQNALAVNVGNDVDFVTSDGDINIWSGIGAIHLTSTAAGNQNLFDAQADDSLFDPTLRLAAITDDGVGATDAYLLLRSDTHVTLDSSVTVTGFLDIRPDDDGGSFAELHANGALTAGNIIISSDARNEEMYLEGTLTANLGYVAILGADNLYIDDSISAATLLDISSVKEVSIAANKTLTASDGALNIYLDVDKIVLTGPPTSTNVFTSHGDEAVQLAAVEATDAASLTVISDGSVTLDEISITGTSEVRKLEVTVDADADSSSTLQINGSIAVGRIIFKSGDAVAATGNDTMIVPDGSPALSLVAGTFVDISKFNTVKLGKGVQVEAADGPLSIYDVGAIELTGTGGTNQFTSRGSFLAHLGDIRMGTPAGNPNVTVVSYNSVTLEDVDIGTGTLDVTVDLNGNDVGAPLTINGTVTAGAIALKGRNIGAVRRHRVSQW